jgi:polysaccharide export outer membrane protein
MPRTGVSGAITPLWVLLVGVCLVCAGCTSQRPFGAVPETTVAAQAPVQGGAVRAAQFANGGVAMEPDAAATVAGLQGANRAGPIAIPNEAEKISHPTYVIEPPDTLLIDAVRLIPRPPYKVQPLDALAIKVTKTLPNEPIESIFEVDPSGNVDLGFTYGSVSIHNQTLKQAKESIEEHLKAKLKPPYEVFVSLFQSRVVQQQVRGEHLVRQDGTIGLGSYGQVYVTGMTIAQAKAAIESHLAQFLFEPKVSLDVSGFNSHVYFVIFDFPGTGQQSMRLPITGNETVLDALTMGSYYIRGLPPGVSKRRIWVARPDRAKSGQDQILPVDWAAITRNGSTATNYQLLPGDRVFVAPDRLASVDIALSRVFAPLERIFGISLFGNSVIQNLRNPNGVGIGGGVR